MRLAAACAALIRPVASAARLRLASGATRVLPAGRAALLLPAACAAFLLLAAAAQAQDRPLLQPSRDVTVTYQVDGAAVSSVPGGIDGPLRVSWDSARQRLRADAASRPQAILVDLPHRTATVLDSTMRAAVALPVRERDLQPLTLAGARMTRRGEDKVAGLACTVWDVQSARGTGTVCVTADGVPLRADGAVDGRRGSFTAASVVYGAVAPGLFAPPPGYFNLNIPKPGVP